MVQKFNFRACQFQLLSHCLANTFQVFITHLHGILTINSLLVIHFLAFAVVQSTYCAIVCFKSITNSSCRDKISFFIFKFDFYSRRTSLFVERLRNSTDVVALTLAVCRSNAYLFAKAIEENLAALGKQ